MPSRETFELVGIPMPPSVNTMYINLPSHVLGKAGNKRLGRVPSKAFRDFKAAVDLWALAHWRPIMSARRGLKGAPALSVSATFFFPRGKLFTKDGRVRKLDTSNRVKALHDALSTVLEHDDSMIFDESARKRVAADGLESVTVTICQLSMEEIA